MIKVNAYATRSTRETGLHSKRFERFSDWLILRRVVARIIAEMRNRKASKDVQNLGDGRNGKDDHQLLTSKDCGERANEVVQNEAFADDISVLKRTDNKDIGGRDELKERRRTLRKSNLVGLDPFLDQDGILRVGGRLSRPSLTFEEKQPILLP